MRSASSIKGYFNNTEDTERNFDAEGFFRTGDIVEQLGPRNLRIIDRKKNIFKLSQGEFVSPEPLETRYMESPYIEQILITCGDSNLGILQTSATAVVVPNQVMLMKWAAEKGIARDFTSLCATKEAKEFVLQNLIELGQQRKLRSFEVRKKNNRFCRSSSQICRRTRSLTFFLLNYFDHISIRFVFNA